MKLIIGEQQIVLDKKITSDEVIGKINEYLAEGYYFSHFIVDGVEVFDEHEEYLNLNLDRIRELEVVAKTEKEFMNDVLFSTEDYLKRAKPELSVLATEFTATPTAETWANFEMLLEGAGWLTDMLTVIGDSNERPANWETYVKLSAKLQGELAKLAESVEQEQLGQISDSIQNDLLLIYESLEAEVGKTIDSEGTRENLS